MNITTDKSYIDSLFEIMGSKKKQCMTELFLTESEIYDMDWDTFQCTKANVIEWLNDFYGVRRK